MLDSIIQLLADAIDAKSPYSGGHCERVPELAEMLIDKLKSETTGPYADFQMSDIKRYEFRLGAWLHDCGKITSPEHIIDKATKLETIYNRIHEIRTRFEVLWRDAQIQGLRDLIDGCDAAHVEHGLARTLEQLQDDFAFVAACNIGSESMAQDDIIRLQRIGARTWQRHFNDRLGLSAEESHQLRDTPFYSLPATEYLLADKPHHKVPWGNRRPPADTGRSCHSPVRCFRGADCRRPSLYLDPAQIDAVDVDALDADLQDRLACTSDFGLPYTST